MNSHPTAPGPSADTEPSADIERRVLLVGATGTVGGATLTAVLRHTPPERVRVLLRRPNPTLAALGVEVVIGDLTDRSTVAVALAGRSAALYVSPHADSEVQLARTFVEEAGRAGVRIVFAGVHVSSATLAGTLTSALMRLVFPAYRPKLAIGALIERTAPAAVLLVPSNFYDNDLIFLPEILAGRYPTPLCGVNRVAASDIGVIAARALLDPSFPAGPHPVCGPYTLDGAQSAAIWACALNRPVVYTGEDPQAWLRAADRWLPAGRKGTDYRASFAVLGRLRLPTRRSDVRGTEALLGRPARRYQDFVRDVVDRLDDDNNLSVEAAGCRR